MYSKNVLGYCKRNQTKEDIPLKQSSIPPRYQTCCRQKLPVEVVLVRVSWFVDKLQPCKCPRIFLTFLLLCDKLGRCVNQLFQLLGSRKSRAQWLHHVVHAHPVCGDLFTWVSVVLILEQPLVYCQCLLHVLHDSDCHSTFECFSVLFISLYCLHVLNLTVGSSFSCCSSFLSIYCNAS